MYPEIPGRAELVLGSPLFSTIVVHRAQGNITIHAPGAGTNSPYVRSLKVNGQNSMKTWLPETFVEHGGTLDYDLGFSPDKSWGVRPADLPPLFEP
jgi:putative alpha-1,2-mannosidase